MKLHCFTGADVGNAFVVYDEYSRVCRIVETSGRIRTVNTSLTHLLGGVSRGKREAIGVCRVNAFLRKRNQVNIQEWF